MSADRPQFISRRRFLLLGAGAAGVVACEAINTAVSRLTGGGTQIPSTGTSEGISTLSPDVLKLRKEFLGDPELNSWQAGNSLPAYNPDKGLYLDVTKMEFWSYAVAQVMASRAIQKGEIRTFDQMKELMGDRIYNWSVESFSDAKEKNALTSDGRYVWVASEENGDLPMAKDSARVLWFQSKDVLTSLLGKGPSDFQVGKVYQELFTQLMGLKGWRDSEILYTRNTYPGASPDGTRVHQAEGEVCSRYEPDIARGQEYKDQDGILHLSNEARFAFIFALSDKVIEVNDKPNDRMAVVKIVDAEGKIWYLQARVFDLWSQPNDLGYIPKDAISEGRGWGAQVLPMCGLGEEVKIEENPSTTPSPATTQPQPQITQTLPNQEPPTSLPPTGRPSNTPFPPATNTSVPPTQEQPTPPTPTPVPTNEDIIPTATQGS